MIDINCDMGEGMANDEALMPYISSANIACGYHAGDTDTIKRTIDLCMQHKVAIGVHPSFYDHENFGRTEIELPVKEIYDLVQKQIKILRSIAAADDVVLQHVKPHGALYNMSAKDVTIAHAIALAVKDYDNNLVLFGLSESHSVKEARRLGLKTKSEVFADRTYQDDGSLTPRSRPNALILDTGKAVEQALQMVNKRTVTAVSGKTIPVVAETICIHGDSEHAVEFAKAISEALTK